MVSVYLPPMAAFLVLTAIRCVMIAVPDRQRSLTSIVATNLHGAVIKETLFGLGVV